MAEFTPEMQRLIEVTEIKLELFHMLPAERTEVMRQWRLSQAMKRAAGRSSARPAPAVSTSPVRRPGTGPLALGAAGK